MLNVEQLLYKVVWGQLQSIGFFTKECAVVDLASESRLHNLYVRWFEETLVVLKRNHYVRQEGDVYIAIDPSLLDREALWREWDMQKAALLVDSNMQAMVSLVDATLRALPDILTGRVLATDIIFPASSMELVEGIYKQNQVADYFNSVLADTVAAYIQERSKQERRMSLRILEIGAGTGGTSATVFQRLQPYQEQVQEYCYTDVSRAFLQHAQREYGPLYPYLTYRLFNVEMPVAGQDIEAGGYDLVIAANVLHATKSIRQTVRNAKAVLKNNGLLLLNEISNNNLFSHLTFGLLEGWWLYEDPELRVAGCPALSPETWQKVLESEGFRDVSFMAPEEHALGQQIVVAQSDGVVRQKQVLQPDIAGAKHFSMEKGFAEQPLNQSAHAMQADKRNNHRQESRDVSTNVIETQTLKFVKETLANAIKLPLERVDAETTFEQYGIDSILQVNFIRDLEKITGELPKTILFEYNNAQELTAYLLKQHAINLKEWITSQKQTAEEPETPTSPEPSAPLPSLQAKTERFRQQERFLPQKTSIAHQQKPEIDDIAIIGISGRYPLSSTLEELWEHLKAGDNCITKVAPDRWQTSLMKKLSDDGRQEGDQTRFGGFLAEIDRFDYQLFDVKLQQVMELTPEIRLFLEIVWETFEDAGYGKLKLHDLQDTYQTGVGVFVGNMYNQYFWNIPSLQQAVLSSNGTDWHIANRVSHFFNLTGPSIAVSSACSSSLNAIHLACESLKMHSCSMAIAGGVNLTLDPSKYDVLQRANLLECGNKSKSFGVADGFIPGEGVGAVLLKPLSKAIQDHDHVYGVIKSSFANHSGGRQMYAAPDPKQQARLIAGSIQQSGIDPTTIKYIECAANGSMLGDAIEVVALQQAFADYTEEKQICALGAVKSNVGHLEAASGMSQLSKVLLQMKHATLVPSIHATPRNPTIKLEKTAFYLQEEMEPWPQLIDPQTGKTLPRRSMINSFGAGGAYVNVIVEEYMTDAPINLSGRIAPQEHMLIFSAKTKWSLVQYLEKIRMALKKNAALTIGDVARSLQRMNHGLENRVVILASSLDELIAKLDLFERSNKSMEQADIYTSFDLQVDGSAPDAVAVRQALEKKDARALARLWVKKARIDFSSLSQGEQISWVALPHYVFDHEVQFTFTSKNLEVEGSAVVRKDNDTLFSVAHVEEKGKMHGAIEIYAYDEPYLKDHKMHGESILVGATHASLTIKAFFERFPEQSSVSIHKLNYIELINVAENQSVEMRVDTFQKAATTDFQVVYRYSSDDVWKLTATGQYRKALCEHGQLDLQSIKDTLAEAAEFQDIEQIYTSPESIVEWGNVFKTITRLYMGHDQILAKFSFEQQSQVSSHNYDLNPLMTNTAYLAMLSWLGHSNVHEGFLPFGINEIQFSKHKECTQGWLNIHAIKNSGEMVIFDVDVLNDDYEVLVRYSGYALKRYRFPVPTSKQSKPLAGGVKARFNHQNEIVKPSPNVGGNDLADTIQEYLMSKINRAVNDVARFSSSDINLMDLGLASSELLQLTQEIEAEAKIELNPTVCFEYPTIRELTTFLFDEHQDAFASLLTPQTTQVKTFASTSVRREQTRDSVAVLRKKFPELLHLNRKYQGEPVFWFHGGQGGVEIYQKIAKKSQRPFYGIQASGYANDRDPIQGIESIATYYIEIIRSVQLEGPYDLGGYSLGGMLAYEIARQLQQAKQEVATIVMIDTPYGAKFKEKPPSFKSLVLQTVNTMLTSITKESEKLAQTLISFEEVDLHVEDEEFLRRLVNLAKVRGLTRTKAQIRSQVQQQVNIQRAYDVQNYAVLPLADAGAIDCYYIRNRNGIFLGDLAPYLTVPNDKIRLDRTRYWDEWIRQIPQMQFIDVDASSHMLMLSEQRASEEIVTFCEKLYAEDEDAYRSLSL